MPIEKIIVLEDDLIVRKNLEQQLRQRRYEVAGTDTLAGARQLLAKDSFDLLIMDVRLPDGEGTELLTELQGRADKPLVVVSTGFASVESAVECMRNGALDYLMKPVSSDQLEVTLKKAGDYHQLVSVNRYLSLDDRDLGVELLGNSPAMENLRQLIRKVGRTQATTLIQGESGTGKELVARALYQQSPRANAPFIQINCAAVPENLIESEFFGHEKGAFTGALNKREGRFELAHGGTLLLDEISEVAPQVQAKLLRVLQERQLERVGGNRTLRVDVRVIATTNRNLDQLVARGEFRQDLYFRLNVVPIHVPPLRDRMEDVPLLAEHFMQRFARKHGVRVRGLSNAARDALIQHNWPGNVRELQNIIERGVILCGDGKFMEPQMMGLLAGPSRVAEPSQVAEPLHGAEPSNHEISAPVSEQPVPPEPGRENGQAEDGAVFSLAEVEKRQIFQVLKHTQGNRTHAAKLLGISIRTLRNKLNEYGC